MKRFLRPVPLLLLSPFLLFGLLFLFLSLPPFLQKRQIVEVQVERGEAFSSVVRKLKAKAVIRNERLFSLWARVRSLDKKIGWGIYRFELPVAPREVLNRLVLGKGAFHRVTIPEGFTVREIADLLEKQGLAKKTPFLAEAKNPEVLSLLGLQGKGIEGYLFPNTYHFPLLATERTLLITMVNQFKQVFTEDLEARARDLGFTRHEVITLASVIEKETGMAAERPLVSAVFHNRLKRMIPLQSDPTVIYGVKNFSGNLTRRDLMTKTPYNTYVQRGLPPGPIGNPGLPSIQAALFPAQVSYLYFVSKNDGSHFFSKTLREHNRAVKIYQKDRQRNRSSSISVPTLPGEPLKAREKGQPHDIISIPAGSSSARRASG